MKKYDDFFRLLDVYFASEYTLIGPDVFNEIYKAYDGFKEYVILDKERFGDRRKIARGPRTFIEVEELGNTVVMIGGNHPLRSRAVKVNDILTLEGNIRKFSESKYIVVERTDMGGNINNEGVLLMEPKELVSGEIINIEF